MFDFRDHTVLVTGASGALGSLLVRRLADAGATRIVALDREPQRLTDRFPELARSGTLVGIQTDLAGQASVVAAVAAATAATGRIDAVFNTVGAFAVGGPAESQPDEHWDAMLDANFRTVLQICRAIVPVLRSQGGGTIVNVGSRNALAGAAGSAAYSVAKTAVLRLTETIAAEGRPDRIRAYCVLPDTLDTPANRAAAPAADRSGWVDPEALCDVLLFLASPESRALRIVGLPVG